MATFFDATWFLWWLFAAAVVMRWYWVKLRSEVQGSGDGKPWRELYRAVLIEQNERRIAQCIEEAEAAILNELAAQLFVGHDDERLALQEARNALQLLREKSSKGRSGIRTLQKREGA